MKGKEILERNDKESLAFYRIDYYLRQLEEVLREFNKSINPELSNAEYLKIRIDLDLFGIFTPIILNESFKLLKKEDKKYIIEKLKRLNHDLARPDLMAKHYKEKNKELSKDKELNKLILIGLSMSRPPFLSNRTWNLEISFLLDFLKNNLIDKQISFSFDTLRQELTKVSNYNQKLPRYRGQRKEFDEWIKDKENRITRQRDIGRGWKKIVFQWMQNDGVAIQQSAAYEYLKETF